MITKLLFTLAIASTLTACACGAKSSAPDAVATAGLQENKMTKGAINGLVKDMKNKPLANVVIVITNTTARGPIKEIAPVTNAKGEFSLSDLPVGEYTLRASSPGYSSQDMKVNVEGTKTSSVDFIMTK